MERALRHRQRKKKPVQFLSVASGVQTRLENNLKGRKNSRLTLIDSNRSFSTCVSPAQTEQPAPVSEAQKVERRRQRKEKQKKEQAVEKKIPFRTVAPKPPKYVPPAPMPSTSGRVTRSQAAAAKNNVSKQASDPKPAKAVKSFAPQNASFRPPEIKNLTKVPKLVPVSKSNVVKEYNFEFCSSSKNNMLEPNIMSNKDSKAKETKSKPAKTDFSVEPRMTTRRYAKEQEKNSKVMKKPTPKNYFESSDGGLVEVVVPRSESSSEEWLRSPKSAVIDLIHDDPISNLPKMEESISPCVTMSRGKENARKEMKQKLKEGLLDEFDGCLGHVDHFRSQLSSEMTRLTELCDSWDKIREQTVLPEHVQEEILSGVELGRLLASSKLHQFAELVARLEPGAPQISEELRGFWNLVYMQIERIDMRFKCLEERRARAWADKPQAATAERVARLPAAEPSRLRGVIAAARKTKKESEEQPTATPEKPPEESKTFEAGFFSVKSPVRHNLLRAVLPSEAKTSASKSSTSFAKLRASILNKSLEDGIAPLPQTPLNPINLGATPGRSILKSFNDKTANCGKKSCKVILLGDETDDDDAQKTGPPKNHTFEVHTDSGQCSLDDEKDAKDKVTPRENPRLYHQVAVDTNDYSGVMTRSRRKRLQTPHTEEKRSMK